MGTIDIEVLQNQRIYLDSNLFIYFLDGREPFVSTVAPLLQSVMDGHMVGCIGDAVIAETMVHPYRNGNVTQIERFRAFFYQDYFLTIFPHDAETFRWASQIAGEKRMKLIDSLHLATALQNDCSYLLTYDKGIKELPDLKVIRLSEFQ